jgi:thioredoxin reductase
MDNFRKHAEVSGSEVLNEMVTEVRKREDHNHFHVVTSS